MSTEQPQDNEQTVLISEKTINTLPAGTVLEEFEILDIIGQGGFGIVYRAFDRSLEREIALKEYMPLGFAVRETGSTVVKSLQHLDTFEAGLRSFINEAKLLAKFHHPSLLNVYRFFEANGTAYMAMPLYQNPTFKEYLEQLQEPPDENWLKSLLRHLLDALAVIHADNCYHRDISPDNILILNEDKPLLLDFGAARHVIQDKSHIPTTIFKVGYAPIEQCGEYESQVSRQGPWTDFYALGAVIYYAIRGEKPVSAISRALHDSLESLTTTESLQKKYSQEFLHAIDQALAFKPADRPQNVAAFKKLLGLDYPTRRRSSDQKNGEKKEARKFPVLLSLFLVAILSSGVWFGMQGKLDMLFSNNSEIINLTLDEARDCLEQAKFECTFAKVDTVLDIDPDNIQAQRLHEEAQHIQQAIQQNISDAKTCLHQAQLDCVITKVEYILQLDPENLHAKTLRNKAVTQHEQYQKLNNTLNEANECFETNNLECALSLSDIVLSLDPGNETALQIQQKIAKTKDTINTALQDGENCLKKSQFDCVQKQLNTVFKLDPNNAQAKALDNQLKISRQQYQTIQKNLGDAKTCLQNAQYECAISKAEVVLNFTPGNQQAKIIRDTAKEKQREAWKNSIIE